MEGKGGLDKIVRGEHWCIWWNLRNTSGSNKYEDGEEETEKQVAKCYNIEYEHSTQGQSEKANSFKNCNFRHLLQKLWLSY